MMVICGTLVIIIPHITVTKFCVYIETGEGVEFLVQIDTRGKEKLCKWQEHEKPHWCLNYTRNLPKLVLYDDI